MSNLASLNVYASDAKLVLSFKAPAKKYRDMTDRRSFHVYLRKCHVLHNMYLIQNPIHWWNRKTTRTNSANTFAMLRKITKTHPNQALDHSKQHMAICGLSLHEGTTESRKSVEQKFISFNYSSPKMIAKLEDFISACGTGGSIVEFLPATLEARVRFPVSAYSYIFVRKQYHFLGTMVP